MIRRPPRSTLFPTRRSSDLRGIGAWRDDCIGADELIVLVIDPFFRSDIGRRQNLLEDRHEILWFKRMDLRSEEHRLNSSHLGISYAVFCLKKKKQHTTGELE